MSKKNKPLLDGDKWHQKNFYSTKPPHDVIRREPCDCADGQRRGSCDGGYESPKS